MAEQNINTELFNKTAQRDHYTMRLARGYAGKANAAIVPSEKKIIARLSEEAEDISDAIEAKGGKITRAIKKRIDALAEEFAGLRTEVIAPVMVDLEADIERFVGLEVDYQNKINQQAMDSLPIGYLVIGATVAAVLALLSNQPVSASHNRTVIITSAITGLASTDSKRIKDTLVAGFTQGDSLAALKRRLKKEFKRTSNIIDTLTRTAVTAASQFASDEIGENNPTVLRGWRNMTILDHRTSSICRLAAAKYKNTVYKNKSSITPVPRHFACRSRVIPVYLSFDDIGIRKVKGEIRFVDSFGQTAREKKELLFDNGYSESDYKTLKTRMSNTIPPSSIETVLENASDQFLRDFFHNKTAYLAYIAGALTLAEMISSEDKSFLTEEEIEAKIQG